MPVWKKEPLGTVCQLVNRGISPVYLGDAGVAVLNQKCIRDHSINVGLGRRHDIVAKKVPADRFIRAGDVLVNSTGDGTLGRVAQLRDIPLEPTTVDSHVTIVRPIQGVFYPDFFGYALIAIEDQIRQGGEGCGGQTELSRTKLANDYLISYPTDINEQRKIVAILDETFEGINAAVANTEKNLANARALFDSYLERSLSTKGPGWVETTLGKVCKFHGGSQPSKSVFSPEGGVGKIRLIQIRDYKSDRHIVYIPRSQARRFCDASDVMIGRYGPPLFQILRGLTGAYNVALMKAVPDQRVLSKEYLFYFLKNRRILRYIIHASNRAAGQIGLNKETLEPYPISFPSPNEQAEIISKLGEVAAKQRSLERLYEAKLCKLAELKQSILYKAFAGELTAHPGKPLQEAAE
jgi:type I restriction enzyme, S subunit